MTIYPLKFGTYQGCIGMEMKRPNSGGAGNFKSYEGSVWTEKSLENKDDKYLENLFGYGKNNRLL